MEETKVILPYDHDREYNIEPLGELPPKPLYSFIKRLCDIVLSVCALIVLAIPMLFIGILVKCTSPGLCSISRSGWGRTESPSRS